MGDGHGIDGVGGKAIGGEQHIHAPAGPGIDEGGERADHGGGPRQPDQHQPSVDAVREASERHLGHGTENGGHGE